MLAKRLEILFDPREYEILKKKAKSEGVSVAELVRKTLRGKILEKETKRKVEALKKLFAVTMETSFQEWPEEKEKIIRTRIKEIATH